MVELISNELEQLKKDISEVGELILSSKSQHVRTLLNDYLNNLMLCVKASEKNINKVHEEPTEKYENIIKYGWVDNKKTVKIFVDNFENLDKHDKNNILCIFSASSFDFKILNFKK